MNSNKKIFNQVIGTPNSSSATKVMLLGGGELGKEIVISLQRYGVETIVIDRYANSPAMQVAHHREVINMTDRLELQRVIDLYQPHIIVPEIEAIHTDTLLEIEQQSKAIVIPTAYAVKTTMNRELIRDLAANKLGLNTSKFAFVDNYADLEHQARVIGFPCIVKPTMSSSGKGQSFVRSSAELAESWQYALEAGRVNHGTVIIEEVIDFDFEITLLTVRAYDKTGEINTYFCDPIGHKQINGDYVESWQPQAMTEISLLKSKQTAYDITSALGGVGVFGVELFIKGDEVWFSEVSPRPHDTGMVTMATQLQSEFELHARAILGLPVDTDLSSPGASHVIYGRNKTNGLSYHNLAIALANAPSSQVRLFGKPEVWAKRRVGVALVANSSIDQARALAQQIVDTIQLVED